MFKHTSIYLLLLATLIPFSASGYRIFGKNKVHYYDYDWRVLKSEHIDLHYYSEEKELAERTIAIAEETFDELCAKMEYTPSNRIPMIIYGSHSEFAETNILPYIIPEGVGGFTELFKNRVVVPFDGSYPRLRHVVAHEMVHFFMFNRLREIYRDYERHDYRSPPFWYTEGLAEYYSTDWNSQGEMTMADAIYNSYYVPLDEEGAMRGSFLAYKEGEAALYYLADTYGAHEVNDVVELAWVDKSYRKAIDLALPVTLDELDKEFQVYLARKYWPRYKNNEPYELFAERLTEEPGLRSGLSWLDHNRLIFLSNEDGYSNLYMMTLDEFDQPDKLEQLVKGDRTVEFEDLYVYKNKTATWGERLVAFAAKSGAREHLYIYDVIAGKTTGDYDFEDIIGITDPCFSPDGERIAFRGLLRRGQADLFILTRATGELRQITDDIYDQAYPAWTNDGIIFSSDRDGDLQKEFYNLYLYNTDSGATERLSEGEHKDLNSVYDSTSDSIYFSSDRTGYFDIYRMNIAEKTTERMSKVLTGAVEVAPRPGGEPDEVAFIAFDSMSYEVFLADLSPIEESKEVEIPLPKHPALNLPDIDGLDFSYDKYKSKLALDFFTADVAYGPKYGTSTGFVLVFTDMLNDHNIALTLANDATVFSELLERTSFSASYYNLHHRVGFGANTFRFIRAVDIFESPDYQTEIKLGGGAGMTYPFDRYNRISFDLYGYNRKLYDYGGYELESRNKASASTRFSHDNSLWFGDGPISGERFSVNISETADITDFGNDFVHAGIDFRYYLRTFKYHTLALRGIYMNNFGPEAEPFYMGGSLSMRGYKYFDFAGNNLGMLNAEYRYTIFEPSPLYTPIGNVGFPQVRGCFLFDAGNCWDNEKELRNWRGSFGFGLRVPIFGALCLRTDHVWLTDFKSVGPFVPIRFYIGWSF